MSMKIDNSYSTCKTDYAERLRSEQKKTDGTGNVQETGKETEKAFAVRDEYISSEKSDRKPSGLYRFGKDENGNPKIWYDDPKKSRAADEEGNSEVRSGSTGKEPEKCIGDTGTADREIRQLKEKKKQLEQQIQGAGGDEKRVRELEQELSRVENELSRKDNDTYRRQNMSVPGM